MSTSGYIIWATPYAVHHPPTFKMVNNIMPIDMGACRGEQGGTVAPP